MNLESLNDLPDWDDEKISKFDDWEGDEWKPNPTRDACKLLYKQWQQIVFMLNGAFNTSTGQTGDNESDFFEKYLEDQKEMILGDAFLVAAKIRSSEAGSLYVIRMENASIIRKNARFITSSLLLFMEENVIDEKHGKVIRDEIDKFRLLFKNWVCTFQKDEIEDEWGLFI